MNTDLIIIGAGPGGYRAAEYAARQGLQVAIVERSEVGGTCLNRGCIPTKAYVHSATLSEAVERRDRIVAQLRAGVEQLLSAPGITLLRGSARLTGPGTVELRSTPFTTRQSSNEFGSALAAPGVKLEDGTTLEAGHIMIATGSQPRMIRAEGIDTDPRVLTSTGLLELTELPRRLCIVGAGVIGMEMAGAFRRFGSEVTVVEYLKECLPMLDSDVAKRLRKLMERQGIRFQMKTAVTSVADIDADAILVATGRRPCTEGLGLETAGIALNAAGAIPVDDNMLAAPGIYAIGDVNGRQLLAHAAEMQGLHAVNHILGRKDSIRLDVMPSAIFTTPEAACVGPGEDQLKADGIAYRCRKAFWRANGKALSMDETEGLLKLFTDESGRLLGCHAFGAHAADIVQEVSALICLGTTLDQLRGMVHIHPTLSEVLTQAAWQE